ncbi:MAG: Pycsar system effector family protein [Armatimonadota bacterium]|nr:DUF5706 domain-containing protein [bacterium]
MEERLRFVFNNINEWLKFAEAKNAALVALNGAAAVAVLSLLKDSTKFAYTSKVCLLCSAALSSLSLILALLSMWPKCGIGLLRGYGTPRTGDNLLFWGDIAKYGRANKYLDALHSVCGSEPPSRRNEEYLYAEQIIQNSQIAVRKYRVFVGSLALLLLAVLALVMAVVIESWI